MFERAMGGASNRPASQLFRLINHKIEVTNAQPRASKILTNSNERIPKRWLVDGFRRTIYTRQNPKAVGGSEKHQAEMLFLFVRKYSSSTPNLQVSTRPPQEPIEAT